MIVSWFAWKFFGNSFQFRQSLLSIQNQWGHFIERQEKMLNGNEWKEVLSGVAFSSRAASNGIFSEMQARQKSYFMFTRTLSNFRGQCTFSATYSKHNKQTKTNQSRLVSTFTKRITKENHKYYDTIQCAKFWTHWKRYCCNGVLVDKHNISCEYSTRKINRLFGCLVFVNLGLKRRKRFCLVFPFHHSINRVKNSIDDFRQCEVETFEDHLNGV